MTRYVAVELTIPDNEAFTVARVFQRLGVAAVRVERAAIYERDDEGDPNALVERIARDEAIVNPNKHRVRLLEGGEPAAGEAWIEERSSLPDPRRPRFIAWRLFDDAGRPLARDRVREAVERLLCNPAIERAIIG